MDPESPLPHSQVPTTSPYTIYGTVTWFALRISCTVGLREGESLLSVMGRILKAVSKRYTVQLCGPTYVGIVLLASIRV